MNRAPIHVVTDASACLADESLWDHPNLTAIPATIRSGADSRSEQPAAGLDDYRDMFADHQNPGYLVPPKTAAFSTVYSGLCSERFNVISIHSSPAVASGLRPAQEAAGQFLGRCDIEVINSLSMSYGLGLLVEAALTGIDQGWKFDDIVRVVRGMIPRVYVVFFLEDLFHLERHGLITRSQAILGNMLGVIAFLTMEDGRLIPMEKVRSRSRALEKMVEFVGEFSDLDRIAILMPSSSIGEEARWIAERVSHLASDSRLAFCDYGPAGAALAGTNGLGVVVLERGEAH